MIFIDHVTYSMHKAHAQVFFARLLKDFKASKIFFFFNFSDLNMSTFGNFKCLRSA